MSGRVTSRIDCVGRRRVLALALGLAGIGLAACGSAEPEDGAEEGDVLAAGAWLAGDAEALRVALGALERLEGTAAAQGASELLERIGAADTCTSVLAHAARASDLSQALRCVDEAAIPPALQSLRGDASLVWSIPLTAERGPSLQGTARIAADGSFRATSSFDRTGAQASTGLARLLVPDERSAGPARLSDREALIHARLRPADGLDLAGGVAAGSQADQLFQLGSSLFTGVALSGTWEVTVYTPEPGMALPPMALGLELSLPDAARLAVDRFVADLEAAWPLRHEPARFRLARAAATESMDSESAGSEPVELEGACFFELRILPDFAPCWAIHRDLLAIGWNTTSLERALEPGRAAGEALDGVELALERWPRAEQVLGGDGQGYPWQRLSLEARAASGTVHLALSGLAEGRP